MDRNCKYMSILQSQFRFYEINILFWLILFFLYFDIYENFNHILFRKKWRQTGVFR
jgi:hypothetical protein